MVWQYTDSTNLIAQRTNADGSMESRLASAIDQVADGAILPYVAPVIPLASIIATAISQLAFDTDAIYYSAVGNRTTEYTLAYADALAYKAAGYVGTVPTTVQSWATANTQTAQWAADNIIAQAVAFNAAQIAIRNTRLPISVAIKTATDVATVTTQMEHWSAFVVAIRKQLGI